MTTITFDTHKLVRQLQDAGFPEKQAELIIEVVWLSREDVDAAVRAAVAAQDTEQRHSLQEVERRLDAKLDLLRSDMNGKFTLLQWMLGLVLAGIASLVIKSFF